jgi:hypothetical protein
VSDKARVGIGIVPALIRSAEGVKKVLAAIIIEGHRIDPCHKGVGAIGCRHRIAGQAVRAYPDAVQYI